MTGVEEEKMSGEIDVFSYLAMLEIFPQPLALPADAAVGTVIDALRAIIVPQLADVAIIPRRKLATISTLACRGLGRLTEHAKHVARFWSIQRMIFNSIMAKATGIPAATVMTLHFDVALVVLAPKNGPLIVFLVVFILCPLRAGIIRGICIFRAQIVVLIGVGGRADR